MFNPAALFGLASSAAKFATSVSQNKQADALGNITRPRYKTPEEIYEAERIARTQAADPYLPGQSVMEDRLGASTANKINAAVSAGTGGDALATIAAADQNEKNALLGLDVAAAQQQQRDLLNLMSQLGVTADYKDREFDYNKHQPFMDKAAAHYRLTDAATQNRYGAIADMAGTLANTFIPTAGLTANNAAAAPQETPVLGGNVTDPSSPGFDSTSIIEESSPLYDSFKRMQELQKMSSWQNLDPALKNFNAYAFKPAFQF